MKSYSDILAELQARKDRSAWAENWRATKAEYFDTAMAKRGITCSGAAG